MEDILVEGILAALGAARDLGFEVLENVSGTFDRASTWAEGSSQQLEGSSEAGKSLFNIVDAIS